MNKLLLSISALVYAANVSAQTGKVGINTETPQATLDIKGVASDPTAHDGIIAPRLTGDELSKKNYTSAQTGALVYVTAPATSLTKQTVNVSSIGYYYFDGSVWQTAGGNDWKMTGNAKTNPAVHFVGTTDDQDLIFKRNGIIAGWLNENNGNTSFGSNSLPYNASVFFNTAVGAHALKNNSTASLNTAVGGEALLSLSDGIENTAVGNASLGGLISGEANIGIGCYAYQNLTSGNQNVAIGAGSGLNITKGSYNIIMGGDYFPVGNGNDQLNIGNLIYGVNRAHSITSSGLDRGDNIMTSGMVGIGTYPPTSTLDAKGSIAFRLTRGQAGETHTMTEKEHTYLTNSKQSITLPQASTCVGREYTIIYGVGENSQIQTPIVVGGISIIGYAIGSAANQRGITLQSDGTDWYATNIF
jgi:hypothetical protein